MPSGRTAPRLEVRKGAWARGQNVRTLQLRIAHANNGFLNLLCDLPILSRSSITNHHVLPRPSHYDGLYHGANRPAVHCPIRASCRRRANDRPNRWRLHGHSGANPSSPPHGTSLPRRVCCGQTFRNTIYARLSTNRCSSRTDPHQLLSRFNRTRYLSACSGHSSAAHSA